ncbi:hypothetical protein JW935_12090 [candidate division KSB1 bacterium]|nr:hypothetical protein [candidate division KSB1 bacterium]
MPCRPDSLAIEKDGDHVYELNEYDTDRGWLVRREYKKGGENLFNIHNKEYGDTGNLQKQLYAYGNYSADSMEYSYDSYNRLTAFKHNGVQERSYYYDDNGNRKSPISGYPRSAFENDNNQLTEFQYQDGGQTKTIDYQFDLTGRCTQSQESSTVVTYNYDVFNNLRTYTIPVRTDGQLPLRRPRFPHKKDLELKRYLLFPQRRPGVGGI